MLLLALVALSVPAAAEELKVCGAPVALKDGWTLAAPSRGRLDPPSSASSTLHRSGPGQHPRRVVVRNGKLVMERYFAARRALGDKLGP
jgi:hypothetical protein